ncbi:MAG: phosphatase PAP2 family protein [Bacteroidota bacterium]
MFLKKSITCLVIFLSFFAAYSQNDSITVLSKDSLSQGKETIITEEGKKDIRQNKSSKMYGLKPVIDIPIIVAGCAWSAFAFPKIYSKEASTVEEISSLNKNNIPSFDRWAAGKTSESANKNSDYFMYGSVAVPFTLLLDSKIRHNAGSVGLMYLEAMSITGLFYSGSVYFVDRYRPLTYNTSVRPEDLTTGNNKDAFIAGHPATVATTTFFAAKVYSDYHPESNFKYVLYGFAIAATGTTVYLRHIAGKHFPSDLFLGVTVGTLSGILVPHFHKNRETKERALGIIPFSNGTMHGICMTYKLK